VLEPKVPTRHTTRQAVNGRSKETIKNYNQKWHPIDDYKRDRRRGTRREAKRVNSTDDNDDDDVEKIDSDKFESSSGEDIEEQKYVVSVGERHSSRIASTQSRPNYNAKVHPQDQLLRKSGIGSWGAKRLKRGSRKGGPKTSKRVKQMDTEKDHDEDEEEVENIGVSTQSSTLDGVQVPQFDFEIVDKPVFHSQQRTKSKEVTISAVSSTQPTRTTTSMPEPVTNRSSLMSIINDSEEEDADGEDLDSTLDDFARQLASPIGIASSFSAGQERSDIPEHAHQQNYGDSQQVPITILSDPSTDTTDEEETVIDMSGVTKVNSSPDHGETGINESDKATEDSTNNVPAPVALFKATNVTKQTHAEHDKENINHSPIRQIYDEN
jgi:hypothetical protein